MKNDDGDSLKESRTVISIIQSIKNGLDAKSLSPENRQSCVELLYFSEGQTINQIAELLRCSEKTVQRDIKELRKRNVIEINPEFSKQLVSDFYYRSTNHANYLMRLARLKDATIAEKISAELGACKVFLDLIEKFQSFGCLPSRPHQIKGEVYHHFDGEDADISLEELKQTVLQIEQVTKEAGTFDEKTEISLRELKARIAKVEISMDVTTFTNSLTNPTQQQEERHE
ncbi:MAG: HTH domain-containing protein [Candidatus Omnitrophica bacterium]|nr:HTH domain-containing protein [Candidatus Omnitrophota bacterium]